MFDVLIRAIENNQTETFLIAGTFAVIIWLYKEIRNTYIEAERNNFDRANKALEVYAQLLIELRKYIDNWSSDTLLDSSLIKAYPYLPKNLLIRFMNWKLWKNEDNLYEILEELGKEILRVKRIQKDVVSYRSDDSISSIRYFLHSIKASSFIQPFIFFTGVLFVAFYILISVYQFSISDNLEKLCVVLTFINSLFYFFFALLFMEILFEKRFISNLKNWVYFSLFIIIPASTIMFYKWYFACISFIFFWVYIKFLLPKSLSNS
ncbi:MAG TPA: hypothetical protein VIO64_20125 [Pseudobacteroides sp.]|uniref:hypothetical protein n=1 Tax=Pseudobacteroides sp. TaxID=1968840 RepID=UPI002F936A65